MNKTQILELLLLSYGLRPIEIQHYRTQSGAGQYEIGYGWRVEAVSEDGHLAIGFATAEGFYDAVNEILRFAEQYSLSPVLVDEADLS